LGGGRSLLCLPASSAMAPKSLPARGMAISQVRARRAKRRLDRAAFVPSGCFLWPQGLVYGRRMGKALNVGQKI
jgi:hypothetical protein